MNIGTADADPATPSSAISRRRFFRDALGALAVASAGRAVNAADYEPVTCTVRGLYRGAPLHAPIRAPDLASIPDRPLPDAVSRRLDDAFARIRHNTAAPALTAAVARPGIGLWQRSATLEAAPRLFWASVGKACTATVILQLAQERRLALDAPVSRWIRDVPNGDVAILRDLVAHTSGLFSSNEDRVVRADPKYRTPAAMLAVARRHGALFCPGANWRYSNTGYDLLGEIIRKVDGRPIDAAITARIIQPLGLTSMRALSPGGPAPGVAPLASTKPLSIEPSWAGAAGPIVSDARDMALFWAALLGGKLLPKSIVAEMTATLFPMFDPGTFYGLGVMVFEVPDGGQTIRWIGHAGGVPGASALAAYSLPHDAIVAVAMTGDGQATAAANLLLKALVPLARE